MRTSVDFYAGPSLRVAGSKKAVKAAAVVRSSSSADGDHTVCYTVVSHGGS